MFQLQNVFKTSRWKFFEGLLCCRELLCQPTCNQCWFVCISIRGRLSDSAEETHILLNELKVNSLNQKVKKQSLSGDHPT